MNDEFNNVRELLHERSEEAPADEYFEEFLVEFHNRQREDLLKRSARSLFVERLSLSIREMGAAKWIYGAGAAYAALMIVFVLWPSRGGSGDEMSLPGERTLKGAAQEKVLHFEPARDEEEQPSEPTEF